MNKFDQWIASLSLFSFIVTYNFCLAQKLWTLSAMTSKNKNDGNSWGTLYGRPMERLAFRYDRHEEIARYFGCGMYTIIQW